MSKISIQKKLLFAAAGLMLVASACQGQSDYSRSDRRRGMDNGPDGGPSWGGRDDRRYNNDCNPCRKPCRPENDRATPPSKMKQMPRCQDRPCGPDQGSSMGSNNDAIQQEADFDANASAEADVQVQDAESPAVAMEEVNAIEESATAASSAVTETVTAP